MREGESRRPRQLGLLPLRPHPRSEELAPPARMLRFALLGDMRRGRAARRQLQTRMPNIDRKGR